MRCFFLRLTSAAALVAAAIVLMCSTASLAQTEPVTRQETLRGSITPEREWRDGLHYDLGKWYINTSREGIGASIWWPNKDIGYDEPDRGMNIDITVPDNLVDVSNGRLIKVDHDLNAKTKTYHWQVKNPINNYGVNA